MPVQIAYPGQFLYRLIREKRASGRVHKRGDILFNKAFPAPFKQKKFKIIAGTNPFSISEMRHIMKIVLIVGSLRKTSFNLELAREAQKLLKDTDTSILDWKDLPLFNQDLEKEDNPLLDSIKKEIASSDGVWFFTPEYNGQIPGGLKNLLDWLSRPYVLGDYKSGTCLKGKPAAISGAGGRNATVSSRALLTKLLQFMGVKVMEEQCGFAVPPKDMADDSWALSAQDIERLKNQAEDFLAFIKEQQKQRAI